MPTIYADSGDGYCYNRRKTTWAGAREDDASSSVSDTNNPATGVSVRLSASRSSYRYSIHRSFFAFDTSGISSAPSAATLKLYGYGTEYEDADVIAVKSSWDGSSLAIEDFDAITGFVAGSSMSGNVTDYSSAYTTWDYSDYNSITLSAAALSDMASLDTFVIAIVNYDYDYLNVAPTSTTDLYYNGLYYTDETGTSKDPYIDYTAGSSSPTFDNIAGVALSSVTKIATVSKANVTKISGVEKG